MSAEQHLKVEWWPTGRVIPYMRNPRKLDRAPWPRWLPA